MPTKSKSKSRKSSRKITEPLFDDVEATSPETMPDVSSLQPSRPKPSFFKIALIVIVLAIVAAVLVKNKSWFVAATVNGAPISRLELNQRLTSRYGGQVLDSLIGERLIVDAANKAGITASNDDLQAKISEIEKTLSGSMKLDDALKMQGLSRAEFENQVRIQILIDKILSKEVSVSAEEIEKDATTSVTLTATDPATRRTQAEQEVRSSKVAEKFQEWFASLKNDAKINLFIDVPATQ